MSAILFLLSNRLPPQRLQLALQLMLLTVLMASMGLAQAVEKKAYNSIKAHIEGLEKPLAENVRLSLNWQEIDAKNISQAFLQRRVNQSIETVAIALQPFGYYNPIIQTELRSEAGKWIAYYNIDPGPVTHISFVHLQVLGPASDSPEFSQLTDHFPLKKGDHFVHKQYEAGKFSVSKKLTENGYLDAELVQSKVTVDRATNSAQIQLFWRSGKQYRFGTLTSHSEYIDSALINRWAEFKPGEAFSYSKLLDLQNHLDGSGFFSRAEVGIEKQKNAGIADVTVETEPAAKRLYRVSLGYGTDTGARGQFGFEQRWLNRYGHSLRSGLRLAENEQSASIAYRVPSLNGRADYYNYSLQTRAQQFPEYETRSDQLSAVQVSRTEKWLISWGVHLTNDRFTVGDESNDDILVYLETDWSRARTNRSLYPDYGNSLRINARLGRGLDSQQTYFARWLTQAQWIRPAPWNGRFIWRAAGGALFADKFDLLPPQHRFFTGGDRTVRGYRYQSLSPVNTDNEKIGGRYLVEGSIEADYRLSESWAAAVFVDSGQAFSSDNPDYAVGLGVGARFITSLLTIRIDLANGITEADKPYRLHLSLGTDF